MNDKKIEPSLKAEPPRNKLVFVSPKIVLKLFGLKYIPGFFWLVRFRKVFLKKPENVPNCPLIFCGCEVSLYKVRRFEERTKLF